MNTPTQNTEQPQWHVDNGAISITDQAHILLDDIGTEREWVSIGIKDEDGIAEVVALAHPINAPLIARAPALLADNQRLREQVAQLTEALRKVEDWTKAPGSRPEPNEVWRIIMPALSTVERGQAK